MAASDDENPYRSPRTAAEAEPLFYWGWRSIPELRDLSRKDRGRVWRRCALKGFRHWQVWAAWAAMVAVMIGIQNAATQLVGRGAFAPVIIASVIGGGLGGWLFGQVLVRCVRPYLADEIAKRESAVS